jgi:plastocyanin
MWSKVTVVLGTAVLCACLFAQIALSDPPEPPGQPGDAVVQRPDMWTPKAAGTVENVNFFFGPYTIGPGQDMNRFDIDLPLKNGLLLSVSPSLRKADDLTEYVHQVAHIHHAHWFRADLFNTEDNYWDYPGFGTHEWIFGNGDEETKADFQPRTDADPNGPIYGQYIPAGGVGPVIYMIHNKTSQPIVAYIRLKVTFLNGSMEELNQPGKRPVHDIHGMLMGRTFDVKRNAKGSGIWDTTTGNDPSKPRPIEWTSQIDGTLIGTGGHVHPGGLHIMVENRGSKEHPCTGSAPGGGTPIFNSEAVWHVAKYSEDFQMSVTDPHWRAPLHKGDRIRLTGYYENKDHAWITAMTHEGFYIDPAQPPKAGCAPYSVGTPAAKPLVLSKIPSCKGKAAGKARRACMRRQALVRRKRARQKAAWQRSQFDPMQGVLSHSFYKAESICGEEYGAPPCNKPEKDRGKGMATDTVTITNFIYRPGDMTLTGQEGAPVQVKQGSSLKFVNADQSANIRHSITTCESPCNGPYVSNYPFADGRWESGTLGYDAVDGGTEDPVAETPKDLAVGHYAYYCRIHPWMRGAFDVVK